MTVSGIAINNGLFFLSHQLQFAFILAGFAGFMTYVLQRGQTRLSCWVVVAGVCICLDPLRHVVYDSQFNPAQCGPSGSLMSSDQFYALGPFCHAGQVLGTVLLLVIAVRTKLPSSMACFLGDSAEEKDQ
ncbi:unnamed protein product [Prorocentrum cordatum]|uniref:Uncharacterized protein n=1 Tax=Prorocentrum cordatum TaxID=2364126 RepID=A0ABN9SKC7_9DINO|nr:unnamed protein product [Polarella glacialis]